jgi:hypothetical protein
MVVLVFVALLGGVVGTMLKYGVTKWWELILLAGLGVLATVSIYNGAWIELWQAISTLAG